MTTSISDFYQKPCDKLSSDCIEASVNLVYDETNPTILGITSSWNDGEVSLLPLVKAGETITRLFLTPTDVPTALQFNREDYGRDGAENDGVDCIEGDALSRIISFVYLKDVEQNVVWGSGYVPMINGNGMFSPYNLQLFVDTTNNTLAGLRRDVDQNASDIISLSNQIGDLNQLFAGLRTRVDGIDQTITSLRSDLNSLTQTVAGLRTDLTTLSQTVNGLSTRITNIETTLTRPANVPTNTKLTWSNINLYSDNTNSNLKTSGLYSHDPNTNVTNDEFFA